MRADAPAGHLRIVRPVLPDRLHWLKVSSLRVGSAVVDLRFERRDGRTTVEASVRTGQLEVQVVDGSTGADTWE